MRPLTSYYEGDVDPDEIFRMFFGGFSPFGAEFQRMNGRNRREHYRQREEQGQQDPRNKMLVLLIQFIPILLIFLSFSGSLFQSVSTT